jgi:hypothetical protein
MSAPTTNISVSGQIVDANSVTMPETKDFRDAWILSDDGTAIEVDWDLAKTNFRNTAKLSRSDFLNAAADAGMVTDDEAITASLGNWPASFNAILSSDPVEARKAKVLWASTTDVSRSSDLLAAVVASDIPITDDMLDAMFGYTGQ